MFPSFWQKEVQECSEGVMAPSIEFSCHSPLTANPEHQGRYSLQHDTSCAPTSLPQSSLLKVNMTPHWQGSSWCFSSISKFAICKPQCNHSDTDMGNRFTCLWSKVFQICLTVMKERYSLGSMDLCLKKGSHTLSVGPESAPKRFTSQ
jgi:hypothetical protein